MSDIKEIILKHHSVNDTAGEHQASDNTLLHDCVPDVSNCVVNMSTCYMLIGFLFEEHSKGNNSMLHSS